MSRCVDLDEKVTAQFYDQEFEEWTMQTVTIEDVLDSVCDEYTVLSSAQPDVTDTNVGDIISRAEAIDALDEIESEVAGGEGFQYEKWRSYIAELPSAQTGRKRGKWIYGEDEYGIDGYHCDKCGFFVLWDYAHNFINYIEDYNFCPNCGAEMREAPND